VTWTNSIGGEGDTPAILYHGTKHAHVADIRKNGLYPFQPTFWLDVNGRPTEPKAVYLTESLRQASAHADYDRERGPDLECLLVVDVSGLPLLRLGFVTCFEPIAPERISCIAEHPALRLQLYDETGWGAPVRAPTGTGNDARDTRGLPSGS
jgi:hypothetical protein